MGEFHIKRIVLPSGKTVEIVYYQAIDGERPADLLDVVRRLTMLQLDSTNAVAPSVTTISSGTAVGR